MAYLDELLLLNACPEPCSVFHKASRLIVKVRQTLNLVLDDSIALTG